MKKLATKIIAAALAFSLVTSPVVAYGATVSARRISVFELVGDDVTLVRGATTIAPRAGQRLAAGNQIHTGYDSFAYLRLDEDSLIRVDQNAQVAISNTSGGSLIIDVLQGNTLVHVAAHRQGQETRTRVGNVGLTVRGTMYTACECQDKEVIIVMLSGYAELDSGGYVMAGEMLLRNEDDGALSVAPIDLNNINFFTLSAIVTNQEYLLEHSSFVTEELLEEVLYIHAVRAEERAIERALQTSTSH